MPAGAEAPARHGGGAAGRDPVDHLRHVGSVRFAPLFAETLQPLMINTLGKLWLVGVLFPGHADGLRRVHRRADSCGDGDPVHRLGDARCVQTTPPILAESAYGLGATTWEVVWNVVLPLHRVGVIGGIMLGLGRALGRDDGGDLRDRQRLQHLGAALRAGQFDRHPRWPMEFNRASDPTHLSALITLGLTLFVLSFIVLALCRA